MYLIINKSKKSAKFSESHTFQCKATVETAISLLYGVADGSGCHPLPSPEYPLKNYQKHSVIPRVKV